MATFEEKLAQIEKKEKDLKEKRKALQKAKNEKEKNLHQKRLCDIGATVEKVLGQKLELEMLPAFERFLLEQESRGTYFSKAVLLQNTEETT